MYSEAPEGDRFGPPPADTLPQPYGVDTWGPKELTATSEDPFLNRQGPPGPYGGDYRGAPKFGGGGFPGGPAGDNFGGYGSASYGGGAPGMSYGGAGRDFPQKRPPYFHTTSLCLLIFLPTGVFLAISLFLATLLHQARAACLMLITICLGMSFLLMAVRNNRGGPNYWFNLGFLCFVATFTASTAGIWNFDRNLGVYWAYEGQRDYSNVLPNEPALNHLDAGRIRFSSDAKLDFVNSVGYKDGNTFCVVPIVGPSPAAPVQFWAAGVDCCGRSGNFTCGDAGKGEVHSGLVYLEPAYKRFRKDPVDQFRLAVREAATLHGLASSPDALFIQWVADPDTAQRGHWKAGVGFLVSSSFVYLAVSVVVGVTLHFGRGPSASRSRAKLEGRSA